MLGNDMQQPPRSFREYVADRPWTPQFDRHPTGATALLECVIVESRPDPLLVPVIGHVSHMLPYAALTVVHSDANKDVIHGNLPRNHRVLLRNELPRAFSAHAYSQLLMTTEFWQSLRGDHVLIFQIDSCLFRNDILNFVHLSYVGAPWIRSWMPRDDGTPCYVGNGGLSLRRRDTMVRVCAAHPPTNAPEDVHFARLLKDSEVASISEALSFSSEMILADSMGCHAPWFWHPCVDHLFDRRVIPVIPAIVHLERAMILSDSDHRHDATEWARLGMSASEFRIGSAARLPHVGATLSIAFRNLARTLTCTWPLPLRHDIAVAFNELFAPPAPPPHQTEE